jgi:hypothetical protein
LDILKKANLAKGIAGSDFETEETSGLKYICRDFAPDY